VKRDYALYRSYESLSKIGSGIDGAIKGYVTRGLHYLHMFKQHLYETHSFYRQVVSLFAVSNGYLDSVEFHNIQIYFNLFFTGAFTDRYLTDKEHIIYFTGDEETLEALLIMSSIECVESDLHAIFREYHQFFLSDIQPRLTKSE
jgi:F-type H+-transporting ATPase subunit alpha